MFSTSTLSNNKEENLKLFMKTHVKYSNAQFVHAVIANDALVIVFGDGEHEIIIPVMNEHNTHLYSAWKSTKDKTGEGYGFLPAAVYHRAQFDLVFSFQEIIKSDKDKMHGIGNLGGGIGITLIDSFRKVGPKILPNNMIKGGETVRSIAYAAYRSSSTTMNYYLHALCDLAYFNANGSVLRHGTLISNSCPKGVNETMLVNACVVYLVEVFMVQVFSEIWDVVFLTGENDAKVDTAFELLEKKLSSVAFIINTLTHFSNEPVQKGTTTYPTLNPDILRVFQRIKKMDVNRELKQDRSLPTDYDKKDWGTVFGVTLNLTEMDDGYKYDFCAGIAGFYRDVLRNAFTSSFFSRDVIDDEGKDDDDDDDDDDAPKRMSLVDLSDENVIRAFNKRREKMLGKFFDAKFDKGNFHNRFRALNSYQMDMISTKGEYRHMFNALKFIISSESMIDPTEHDFLTVPKKEWYPDAEVVVVNPDLVIKLSGHAKVGGRRRPAGLKSRVATDEKSAPKRRLTGGDKSAPKRRRKDPVPKKAKSPVSDAEEKEEEFDDFEGREAERAAEKEGGRVLKFSNRQARVRAAPRKRKPAAVSTKSKKFISEREGLAQVELSFGDDEDEDDDDDALHSHQQQEQDVERVFTNSDSDQQEQESISKIMRLCEDVDDDQEHEEASVLSDSYPQQQEQGEDDDDHDEIDEEVRSLSEVNDKERDVDDDQDHEEASVFSDSYPQQQEQGGDDDDHDEIDEEVRSLSEVNDKERDEVENGNDEDGNDEDGNDDDKHGNDDDEDGNDEDGNDEDGNGDDKDGNDEDDNDEDDNDEDDNDEDDDDDDEDDDDEDDEVLMGIREKDVMYAGCVIARHITDLEPALIYPPPLFWKIVAAFRNMSIRSKKVRKNADECSIYWEHIMIDEAKAFATNPGKPIADIWDVQKYGEYQNYVPLLKKITSK